MKKNVEREFSEKISRLSCSKAYLDVCEEVYGYRLPMFNMMDKEQIDFLLNSIPISPSDSLLDLGCGNGCILRLLTANSGCHGVGIDLIDGRLTSCGEGNRYIYGDFERIDSYNIKPTLTIAVDSLYFCTDIDVLIKHLASIDNNRLYLFWSQYFFDKTASISSLKKDNTPLALSLQKEGESYKTMDFSENERLMYYTMEKVLRNHEHDFESEGNLDLFEQKLKETLLGIEFYENGLASRYLYILD